MTEMLRFLKSNIFCDCSETLLLPNTVLTSQKRGFTFSDNDFCHSNSSILFNIRIVSIMSVFADFKFELNFYLSLFRFIVV